MFTKIINSIRYNLFAPIPKERKSKPVKDRIRKIRYLLFGRLPFLGRKVSKGETSKAKTRRLREDFFDKYCQGKGLDIGYGGDPVTENVQGWDYEHGDAQYLKGVADESYDFVHSSHLLEHLPDTKLTLSNWWRVLKHGGYLILYVPHRDLYEKKKELPSQFNDDHLHFFLPEKGETPDTIGISEIVSETLEGAEVVYIKVCDEGYIRNEDNVQSEGEYSIEAVIKKI